MKSKCAIFSHSVYVLSKVIESVMLKQLVTYFKENGLLYHQQFGFRSDKSITLAIEHVVSWILDVFESKQNAIACMCDLSKAFDCLPHDVLLKKLGFYWYIWK